jgi:hypothetical protein
MHTQPSELDALIQALDKAIHDRAWLKFLELTSRTGVADTRQLQLHLGWTRGIFSRRAEKLLISTLNGEPLVSQIDRTIKRPTEANRPPAIFRLEKGGAQLLRSMGYESARASELKEDIPILHALGMVTLSQVLQKDASAIVDQIVCFGDDRHIRPDIVVVPAAGKRRIYEFEQEASSKLAPRILESITNKEAFFQCIDATEYSSDVCMVVNVKDGRHFYHTTKIWVEVMRQYTQEHGPLHFDLYAIPFKKFLQSPGMEDIPSQDWKKLNASEYFEDQTSEKEEALRMPALVPATISMKESVITLRALGRTFRRSVDSEVFSPEYGMLDVVRTIYHESYPLEDLYFENVASFPIASVYALSQYLNLQPRLKKMLRRRMAWDRDRARMSPINVQDQMRKVIHTFMEYHRWQPDEATLNAYATADREKGGYLVVVTTKKLPHDIEKDFYEIRQSLRWVLQALFDYPEHLGIVSSKFLDNKNESQL